MSLLSSMGTLDDIDIAVAFVARTGGLAVRETIWRRFFAMTQGSPKIPPWFTTSVAGSVDHHDCLCDTLREERREKREGFVY